MTAITTEAHAKGYKLPLFVGGKLNRKRWAIALFIGNVNTGLTWRYATKRQMEKAQTYTVDHAAEILEDHGIMDRVYAKIALEPEYRVITADKADAEPTEEKVLVGAGAPVSAPIPAGVGFSPENMPRQGQRVRLTAAIGNIAKGTEGTVTRIDPWIDGYDYSNQYPVRVALPHAGWTPEIPLHLHEIEAA